MNRVERIERDRAIVAGYVAGNSLRQLAWVFGISERRVSGIVAEQHAQRSREDQQRLNAFARRRPGAPRLVMPEHLRADYARLRQKGGAAMARAHFGIGQDGRSAA